MTSVSILEVAGSRAKLALTRLARSRLATASWQRRLARWQPNVAARTTTLVSQICASAVLRWISPTRPGGSGSHLAPHRAR